MEIESFAFVKQQETQEVQGIQKAEDHQSQLPHSEASNQQQEIERGENQGEDRGSCKHINGFQQAQKQFMENDNNKLDILYFLCVNSLALNLLFNQNILDVLEKWLIIILLNLTTYVAFYRKKQLLGYFKNEQIDRMNNAKNHLINQFNMHTSLTRNLNQKVKKLQNQYQQQEIMIQQLKHKINHHQNQNKIVKQNKQNINQQSIYQEITKLFQNIHNQQHQQSQQQKLKQPIQQVRYIRPFHLTQNQKKSFNQQQQQKQTAPNNQQQNYHKFEQQQQHPQKQHQQQQELKKEFKDSRLNFLNEQFKELNSILNQS
ncbi:hypothetical protein ABPG72_015213 [Tetrahymena utriculariae]